MVNYDKFNITDNHAFNIYHALKYCKDNAEDALVFNKGIYEIYGDMASEDTLLVSNNDIYGLQRIAFLIKEMNNFCIDGGGSEFIFHGSVVPFAVKNSKNITIKNLSIDIPDVMTAQLCVDKVNENSFDATFENDCSYHLKGDMLYYTDFYGNENIVHYFSIRSQGDETAFSRYAKDSFRVFSPELRFEDLGDKKIRVYGSRLNVTENMHLISRGCVRYACNIILVNSKDLFVEDVTMYKSYSMGLIAQKCENVSIDKMVVKAKKRCLYSCNCDATHFVHCKGEIKVTNSSFSEQLDDAINVHGIFTRIVDKTDDYILIKYMHPQAKGVDVYEKGDEIAVLNPKTLIPNGKYTVSKVEVININYTKLFIEGGTDRIKIGDDVEDLTWSCDLIFENNKVTNNRARGMLIAAKGKVLIKNNYINTPGVAILFESDGSKWFESGGTTDVEIKNNVFENCNYSAGWGENVIWIKPREEFGDLGYYHNRIEITDNEFLSNDQILLNADNVKELIFKNNTIKNQKTDKVTEIKNCERVDCDVY